MLKSGWFFSTSLLMACRRCVFPRPEPPQINSGLYAPEGFAATACAAACANLLVEPTIKFSNVKA